MDFLLELLEIVSKITQRIITGQWPQKNIEKCWRIYFK
jgi:hypothetical protein